MNFLKSDLFHNLAIGFAVGGFVAVLAGGPEMWGTIAPDAVLAFIR